MPAATIGDGAEVGNFAEQKNVRFGARSKQHHFSYLGDAEIGDDVNIGAGTITANYDGRRKHRRSSAAARSSAATRSCARRSPSARAPTPAPAAVVTKDVPPGKLAVGLPARIRERRVPAEDNGSQS